jgi:hypothetical protein
MMQMKTQELKNKVFKIQRPEKYLAKELCA